MNIHIAIADDEALFLNGLKGILERAPSIQQVTALDGGEALLDYLTQTSKLPDLVILDLRMKGLDGVETTQQLKDRYPELKIIILSSHYRDAFLGYMVKLGVNAFLPKSMAPQDLIGAVEKVHEKGLYFTEAHVNGILEQLIKGQKPIAPNMQKPVDLTKREVEILELICEQYTNAEMADKLFVSIRTIEAHRNNMMLKIGAKNTVGMVLYALLHNVVDTNRKLLEFTLA